MQHRSDVEAADALRQIYQQISAEIGKVIIGQEEVLKFVLISIFSNGHCLLVGVPGLAKTLMVQTVAQVLDLDFKRIQFTPDLMPSDIIGSEILGEDRNFKFIPGPVFANIILADEINRTPPKTQAALLEAMQEKAVTAAGVTHRLAQPFFVLATQNPIEQEGTYQLPEAQIDRFMLKVIVDYPSRNEEQTIIRQNTQGMVSPEINPVASTHEILEAKDLVRQIYLDEKVEQYILDIVFATRFPEKYHLAKLKPLISYGGSPRASINIALAAKAYAYLNRRGYVVPEDIRSICKDVLRHRIGLTYEAEAENVNVEQIINEILRVVNVP